MSPAARSGRNERSRLAQEIAPLYAARTAQRPVPTRYDRKIHRFCSTAGGTGVNNVRHGRLIRNLMTKNMFSRPSALARKALLWLCAAVALHATATARATEDLTALATNFAPLGRLIVTQFVTAPFPHPARAEGHKYHDEFFSAAEHYSDSTVTMFVPKNFRAADKIDFVVHFHGWRNTVAGTLEQFKLVKQLCASGKNAILIVPEGPRNAADSFGGKLEDTNGFAAFMNEAVEKLRASGALAKTNFAVGSIILSGHSGGYHVMAAIVDHGGLAEKIREVWLFDALYGGTEKFVAWQKNQNGRLLDIYTDHGGTKEETQKLIAAYQTKGASLFAGEDTNASPENLRTNNIVFLHTDMVHDDVVAKPKTFEQFLQTSCLDDK